MATNDFDTSAQTRRLHHLLRSVVLFGLVFEAGVLVALAVFRMRFIAPVMIIVLGSIAGSAAGLLQLRRNQIGRAAASCAIGVLWTALTAPFMARAAWYSSAIAAVLAVTVVLPHLPSRQIHVFVAGTVALLAAIGAYAVFGSTPSSVPPAVVQVLNFAAIIGLLALVLFRLVQYHTRSQEHVSHLEESLQEIAAARAREAQLARDNAELEVARRVAEESSVAKASFLSNMSHEIRTPMNAIIGMTSILLDTPLNHEQQDAAEVIRTSGEHLLGLISDILDYTKIEAGHIELERATFSIRECIETALDLVAASAQQKNVELGYLMDAGVPESVLGDQGRLRQILLNLLSNAVKFTPAYGQVLIEVEAQLLPGAQGKDYALSFTVKDTGIGIAQDVLPKLFRPFTQADISTTRRFGGTGLGLSICKRLCELMNGSIEVSSELGKGSVFRVTIQAAAAVAVQRYLPATTVAELRGRRVLIVDDIEINRRILQNYISTWGMVDCATASPDEALVWVRRGDPFDLALIDYHMPEMNGLVLALELRKLVRPELLTIVLVGSIDIPLPSELLAAQLPKPIKPARLLEVIEAQFLETHKTRATEKTTAIPADLGERHPLRILVAEDNPVNQMVAKRLLARLGYQADAVADGMETLEALGRQHYDVVLMDVQMPRMDGLAATREICRRWSPLGRPRIIGMTANVDIEDRQACKTSGMDDYIAKPVTVERLVQALERCHRRHGDTQAEPEVDEALLDTLKDTLGEETFQSILNEYLSNAALLLGRLETDAQAASLQQAAHDLKSTSATVGARALSAVAAQIEACAKDSALADVARLIGSARALYETLAPRLRRLQSR